MRIRNLGSQKFQLRGVQTRSEDRSKDRIEVGRCDGRDKRGDVGECAVECGDWCVVEVVPVGEGLHLIERRVSCANYCHGARSECCAVRAGEVAGGASGGG